MLIKAFRGQYPKSLDRNAIDNGNCAAELQTMDGVSFFGVLWSH